MTELDPQSKYSFDCAGEPLVQRILFITGVNRSGTTLLGNLVGSFKDVEYDFEPWIFHCVPMMAASGQIPDHAAEEIFRGYFNETLTSSILGRNFNFRPSDDTNISRRLSSEEINRRWSEIKDRRGVKKYAGDHGSLFCVKAINFMPFLGLLWEKFPQIKFVEIIRHPFQVALSIQKKGWVSLEKLQMLEGLPIKRKIQTKDGSSLFIPWWVQAGDVNYFLGMNEFVRAIYAWRVLTEMSNAEKKRLGIYGKMSDRYLEVKFEDLLQDPSALIQKLAAYTGKEVTPQTETLAETIRSERLKEKPEYPLDSVPESERKKVAALMETTPYRYEAPQYA